MDFAYNSPVDEKIGEKLNFEETSEETLEDNKEMNKQSPLYHILEKQAKELEEFGRRMTLELQSSYINKQLNEKHEVEREVDCHECKEKTKLINTLRAHIDELESNAKAKNEDIKKLQRDVRSLFDIMVKRGQNPVEKTTVPAKITITTEIDGAVNEVDDDDDMYYDNNNIKDSYSDSAVDLFTDDEDYSSTGGSVRSDEEDYYGRPSEWLDVSPAYKQRTKIDKRNLDRWNSKMASNGLLPIRLVGKVDSEREKKYQTHRKGYSTSAIWLKTYENTRKKLEQQSRDEKFKLPSFNFSFGSTENNKKRESLEIPAPISLKSTVSTSVSELTTCSVTTTSLASNTLKPYDMFHKDHKINIPNNNSSRLLSQYK